MVRKGVTSQQYEQRDGVEFEDAVSATGYGIYNISLLLVCGGLLMAVIMETMSMSYILPAAQCDLNLSSSDKNILSAVSFLGVVLSSHLWGFIGDTAGRKYVVLVTTYISFAMTILSSITPYVWLFILFRFLNGFFIGGPSAVTYAYLGEFHNNVHRAKVLSWAASFIAVATIVLPAMAWIILPMEWSMNIPGLGIDFRPWRFLVILYGLPGVISATLLLLFPESPKFLWVQGETDKSLTILQKMYAVNKRRDTFLYPVKSIKPQAERITDAESPATLHTTKSAIVLLKTMWNQTAPLFKSPLILKTFMTCTLQFGVFASSSGFLMWTPEILNKLSFYMQESNIESATVCQAVDHKILNVNNTDNDILVQDCLDVVQEEVFAISLILGAVFAMGYIIIGIIINLTGKKTLLASVLTITGIAGLSINVIESYGAIVVVLAIFLSGGTCVSIINTVVVDLYPTQYRAMAMAISLMMGRFGAVVGSHVVGSLLQYSCHLALYIFAGEYLVLMVIALLLPPPLSESSKSS